jgi:intein-encoded DNA endonuclease-like protein
MIKSKKPKKIIDINKVIELRKQNMSYEKIGKILKTDRRVITKRLEENGIKFESINENTFKIIDTEEKAYWLGFLYADGYLNPLNCQIEVALKEEDKNHLKKLKEFLNVQSNITEREVTTRDKKYKSVRLSFANKNMFADLINLGCAPAKSLTLTFPNDDIVPLNLKRHFMRGFIDGDGCLVNTDKTYCLSFTSTKEFIQKACECFNLRECKLYSSGKAYTWRSGHATLVKQYLKIFYNDSNIYLDRKYKKYLEMTAV